MKLRSFRLCFNPSGRESVKSKSSIKKSMERGYHVKARGLLKDPMCSYGDNLAMRFQVTDKSVDFKITFNQYYPTEFTADFILKTPPPAWADPSNVQDIDFSNKLRMSHEKNKYQIDINNRPMNPRGRTGMTGRGILGKWGPNHAADPLVTRINKKTGNLEFIAIKRKDNQEWAIPGGMVDAGETVSLTLSREFSEEALNSLQLTSQQKTVIQNHIKKLFNNPTTTIYKGYVDDPRNTDNAWMETVCVLYHDADGKLTENLNLDAGDDAKDVRWMKIDLKDPNFKLYASHKEFIEKAVKYIERLGK